MKHRRALVVLGLIGAVALVAALSIVAASGAGTTSSSRARASSAVPAPKVPNAKAIKKKYGGQSITFVGDSVGDGHVRDTALATRFTTDTGIKVTVEPHPSASDQAYADLVRAFSSKSSSIDVAMIDVVWPGAFAPYLVNLKPKLGKQAKLHLASIVANDTIKGRLVAMPWFGDYGILYYRTDLLKKYGYKAPPKTWSDLFKMAKKIQAGERVPFRVDMADDAIADLRRRIAATRWPSQELVEDRSQGVQLTTIRELAVAAARRQRLGMSVGKGSTAGLPDAAATSAAAVWVRLRD